MEAIDIIILIMVILLMIACYFIGFARGNKLTDCNSKEFSEFPKCTCHNPQWCDIPCRAKEQFRKLNP